MGYLYNEHGCKAQIHGIKCSSVQQPRSHKRFGLNVAPLHCIVAASLRIFTIRFLSAGLCAHFPARVVVYVWKELEFPVVLQPTRVNLDERTEIQ